MDCLQLGDALVARGQRTQAMICYGQALVYEQLRQFQPKDPEIYGMLRDIYAEQKQWQAAVEYYQTAVQLNLKLTSVQEALGDIWSRQGQWQKAGAYYQQVLQKSPELWEVHYKLGDVLGQ